MGNREGYQDVEAIYDALDRGDPEAALKLTRQEMAAAREEDPVLRFLAGMALLELHRPQEAADHLRKAVELDPEDAEFRSQLALCLYHACRLEEAMSEARTALQADDKLPDAHQVYGLLLETQGRYDEADRHLMRASELDPEGFPPPLRMTREAFEQRVSDAGDRLPEAFRRHLAQLAITVEHVPSRQILMAEEPPLDPGILGLFVGVALPEQTHFSPGGELPPRIYLFQRNLERYAQDAGDLEEQIATTLYHELGHYLGLDEEELADINLG